MTAALPHRQRTLGVCPPAAIRTKSWPANVLSAHPAHAGLIVHPPLLRPDRKNSSERQTSPPAMFPLGPFNPHRSTSRCSLVHRAVASAGGPSEHLIPAQSAAARPKQPFVVTAILNYLPFPFNHFQPPTR